MSPEQRQIEELQKRIEKLERAENVPFIESLQRRLGFVLPDTLSLNDLVDVDTSGVTNGQVIKYTSATGVWDNANDNTA